ncbi:MAG TPA: ribonuclease Z [Solirubrobacteraceae bacterium]|nr:ribonuclease Z [Solirubrobacteraceae bacterium]
MRIVVLGTSSARPTLRRNVSATAVEVEGETVLFDCGEGTQRQALRAGIRFSRLSLVAITHLHGDHVNGLFGLLGTLVLDGRERPLRLVGPPGLGRLVEMGRALRLFSPNYRLEVREFSGAAEVFRGDGFRVHAQPLNHLIQTQGYCLVEDDRPGRFDVARALELGVPAGPLYGLLQHGEEIRLGDGRIVTPGQVLGATRRGRRVAYCLDTRPCEGGVILGRDATLLIHESTFGDDATIEAAEYGHSTARQAAAIAKRAGAARLLLTHFSSRYAEPDMPRLLAEAREVFPETLLAEDLCAIDLGPAPPG